MTRLLTRYPRYHAGFQEFERALAAHDPAWLRRLRRDALDSFEERGFPTATRGNEEWKYTRVAPIAETEFTYPISPPAGVLTLDELDRLVPDSRTWLRLVFLNGRYAEPLSTPSVEAAGIRVLDLQQAVATVPDLVQPHLAQYARITDDGFTALNTAFLHHGAFVHVPAGLKLGHPLHIVYLTMGGETTPFPEALEGNGEPRLPSPFPEALEGNGGSRITGGTGAGPAAGAGLAARRSSLVTPTVTYPRTLVILDRAAAATIVETFCALPNGPRTAGAGRYFTNAVTEICLADRARLDYYRLLLESPDAFHVGLTRVRQAQDSAFHSTSFALGAAIARNDLHVFLDEPGAACDLRGLHLTSGTQHIDNHIDIDHVGPSTSSDQYFKGILAGRSRAVFSGRVRVHKQAQKTRASQADKNLVLSDGAEIDSKPSLEIYADDVQCTHGATAGAVAEDALFYMRSRGLDIEEATRFLIQGFAREIVDEIPLKPLRTYLEHLAMSALPAGSGGGESPSGDLVD